ncbi:hypothetical protein F4680DRAFT_412447 [Xylaria scruposa]|nr:hypothetical protein F4680DRAFT_412447 [Xylaria scruposa]
MLKEAECNQVCMLSCVVSYSLLVFSDVSILFLCPFFAQLVSWRSRGKIIPKVPKEPLSCPWERQCCHFRRNMSTTYLWQVLYLWYSSIIEASYVILSPKFPMPKATVSQHTTTYSRQNYDT